MQRKTETLLLDKSRHDLKVLAPVAGEGRLRRITIEYDDEPEPAKPKSGINWKLWGTALFLVGLAFLLFVLANLGPLSWTTLLPFLLAALGGILHEALQSGTLVLPQVMDDEVYLGHLGGAAIGFITLAGAVAAGAPLPSLADGQGLAGAFVTGLGAKGAVEAGVSFRGVRQTMKRERVGFLG